MARGKILLSLLVVLVVNSTTGFALALPGPGSIPSTANPPTNSSPVTQPTAVIPSQEDSPTADSAESTPTIIANKQAEAAQIRSELTRLADELEVVTEEYLGAKIRLMQSEQEVSKARDELRWFEAELEAQRQLLNERVTNIYKHGQTNPLEVVVNSGSLSAILERFSLLMRIGENDASLVDRIHRQKRKVENQRQELRELIFDQTAIVAEIESRKAEIETSIKTYEQVYASITAEIKTLLDAQTQEEMLLQESLRQRMLSPVNRAKMVIQPGTITWTALQYLGVPYVWGGETPAGFDCSGLVKYVFAQFGVELPHYSRAQFHYGTAVSVENLAPGDLVFFGRPIHHVAIYIGEDYIVEAPRRGEVVKITRLSEKQHYVGARRILSGR